MVNQSLWASKRVGVGVEFEIVGQLLQPVAMPPDYSRNQRLLIIVVAIVPATVPNSKRHSNWAADTFGAREVQYMVNVPTSVNVV
jgi:hypothetical protein